MFLEKTSSGLSLLYELKDRLDSIENTLERIEDILSYLEKESDINMKIKRWQNSIGKV